MIPRGFHASPPAAAGTMDEATRLPAGTIPRGFRASPPAAAGTIDEATSSPAGTLGTIGHGRNMVEANNKVYGNKQQLGGVHEHWATGRLAGAGGFRSMNFVQSILDEDEQNSRKKKTDFVHIFLNRKKTFVTVTDAMGNKKTGASAGSLEGRKGQSRLSRYAAEATAEHVGRTARKIGLKSVVMKVKGAAYFRKKKKVILSWREGFKGEGVGGKSRILSIHDVTQLPHNGCRLRKQRRV